jgi:CRISPR/Cas system endoribonuclease Cas6 (RAMP superfamily)
MESKTRYEPGETFCFELLLFGRAMQYLAYFVVAFRELAERGFGIGRGRCRLQHIDVKTPEEGTWASVYSAEDQCVRPAGPSAAAQVLMAESPGVVSEIAIEFQTPTELKHDGSVVRVPEFHHLLRRLRDRINAIGWFYGGVALDLDFAEFGRRAERVTRVESDFRWSERQRLSTRTHQRHSIGGFLGRVRYQGELKEFLPFLRLGEWAHVGKHAVWGNGQYRIVSL